MDIKSYLLDKRQLKKFLTTIFTSENKLIDRVDIIFCSDAFLLGLNKEYLGHTYHTDTLTFVYSKKREPIWGDVYISIERIIANSKSYRDTYKNELARVIIHGCLHLCGYVDKPKQAATKMLNRQEEYLKSWIVSRET